MTNSNDSGIGNALCVQRKFQLKKEIYNYQSSLSMVNQNYTHGILLSILNNNIKLSIKIHCHCSSLYSLE